MSSLKESVTGILRKPPLAFLLIGLFHVLWLGYTIWSDRHEPFPGILWLDVVWMAGYTTCWLAACDLRKWGMLGYVALTFIDVALYLLAKYSKVPAVYVSDMFVIDVLFSMLLLYYYKIFS